MLPEMINIPQPRDVSLRGQELQGSVYRVIFPVTIATSPATCRRGAGMFGFGILSDAKGNDTYQMGFMGQGFGLFGMGILVDFDGNDRYIINGLGQGARFNHGVRWIVRP